MAEQVGQGKEHTGLNGRESGSHRRSLTQAKERFLVGDEQAVRDEWKHFPWVPLLTESLRAWQGSPGTISSTHLTGHCLAAFGVNGNTWLRYFPADSLLRTAIPVVSRQLLDRPEA